MEHLKIGFGCLLIFIILIFALLYAKFLVPIVPLLFAAQYYFTRNFFYKNIDIKTQKIQDLKAGKIKLEGKVVKISDEIKSPYLKQICIGYKYTETEYVFDEDSHDENMLTDEQKCEDFFLNTADGQIKIIGKGLELKQLPKLQHRERIAPNNSTEIEYTEHLLKNKDEIIIIATANNTALHHTQLYKIENKPFFATTVTLIDKQRKSMENIGALMPWFAVLYMVVNYFLFIAPQQNMPVNQPFIYSTVLGLPVLCYIFYLLAGENKDPLSRLLQYLSGVCGGSIILILPLLVLFYFIELDFSRTYHIVLSIILFCAVCLFFVRKRFEV